MPRAVLSALSLCLALGAQSEVDVTALLRELRGGADTEREAEVVEALLRAGEHGCVPLAAFARSGAASLDSSWRRLRARHLRAFEKAAPQVLRSRMGRDGPHRVAELQARIRELSRQPELAKATITGEIDPRLAELEALLQITPEQVLAGVPKLREQAEELERDLARLIELFDIVERAEEVLAASPSGRRALHGKDLAPDPRDYAEELREQRVLLARLATPMSAHDVRVLRDNLELARELDPEEARGILELNRLRILLGLGAVRIDVKLCAAARGHSQDMERLGFFSHTSPVPGKETFGQRAALAGTSAQSENIAAGQSTGEGAIRAWWYSPGHHRNMTAAAARVGLGRSGGLWTQMFGG